VTTGSRAEQSRPLEELVRGLQKAKARLEIVMPIRLLLIFVLPGGHVKNPPAYRRMQDQF
jgi:hypothetical protein